MMWVRERLSECRGAHRLLLSREEVMTNEILKRVDYRTDTDVCVFSDASYDVIFSRLNNAIGLLRFMRRGDFQMNLEFYGYAGIPQGYTLRHIYVTPQPCVILEAAFVILHSEDYELLFDGKVVLTINHERLQSFVRVNES